MNGVKHMGMTLKSGNKLKNDMNSNSKKVFLIIGCSLFSLLYVSLFACTERSNMRDIIIPVQPENADSTEIAQNQVDTIYKHWSNYISLDSYLTPFTKADTIVNEIVLPVKYGDEKPFAQLLFPVEKILSIKDVYLDKEYKVEEDWVVDGRKLILSNNSKIPYLEDSELLFRNEKKETSLPSKKEGYYVLFSEGQLFPSYQLSVTYVPDKSINDLSFPDVIDPKPLVRLKRTHEKLRKGQPLNIVFYGNSIEVGGNSSGFQGVSPYMPNWTQLVIYNLRNHYSSSISYTNNSVGGMTAKWGEENADELVALLNPDLVVIAFGMNDGTGKVPVSDFINQLRGIMRSVCLKNPKCEFILVTPMLANPLAIHSQIQEEYRLPIWSLAKEGVSVADVTVWHKWLLSYKSYQDMTGNNINHPNDYLARWYAHIVSELLIRGKEIL